MKGFRRPAWLSGLDMPEEMKRLLEQEHYVNPALAKRMAAQCDNTSDIKAMRRAAYPVITPPAPSTMALIMELGDNYRRPATLPSIKAAKTSEEIIESVAQLFQKHQWELDAVSIARIRSVAGVSYYSLKDMFGTKENLYNQCLEYWHK